MKGAPGVSTVGKAATPGQEEGGPTRRRRGEEGEVRPGRGG